MGMAHYRRARSSVICADQRTIATIDESRSRPQDGTKVATVESHAGEILGRARIYAYSPTGKPAVRRQHFLRGSACGQPGVCVRLWHGFSDSGQALGTTEQFAD